MAGLAVPPCPTAVRGHGKLHRTLRRGWRQRRSGEGAGAIFLPNREPLTWLPAKNLLTRQGPNPRGGRDQDWLSKDAFVLPDRLPSLPPGHQTCFPPKKHAFSHPPRATGVAANLHRLPTSCVLPRFFPGWSPTQPAPGPPPLRQPPALLQQRGLGRTWRDLKNVKVAVNSICVHCGVGASKKKRKVFLSFLGVFFMISV